MSKQKNKSGLFFPLLIITIGIILLLKTLSILDEQSIDNLLKFWPILLIIAGLDGFYQGNGYVGPTISIGAGVVFLFGNLGYIDINIWNIILNFWPVLIIAAGFDILFARRSFLMAVLGIIFGIALLAGMILIQVNIINENTDVNSQNISVDYNDQTYADIYISPGLSNIFIGSDTPNHTLLEANINLGNHTALSKKVNEDNDEIRLEDTTPFYSFPFFTIPQNGIWDIQLNPDIPINLETDLIIGKQTLDLQNLHIYDLETGTIIGQNTIYFPRDNSITAHIILNIGENTLLIPENAKVNIQADTALTLVNLPTNYSKSGDLIKSSQTPDSRQTININITQPMGILNIDLY